MNFAYGETVTRLRAPLVTDRYGSQVRDWANATRTDIPGGGLAPRPAGEEDGQGREGVIIGWTWFAPAGTDILATDRVEVRGEVHQVDGEPADWRSPFTGWHPGIAVNLRRVEG